MHRCHHPAAMACARAIRPRAARDRHSTVLSQQQTEEQTGSAVDVCSPGVVLSEDGIRIKLAGCSGALAWPQRSVVGSALKGWHAQIPTLTSSDTPAHYSLPTTFTATLLWPIPRPLRTARTAPTRCCASPSKHLQPASAHRPPVHCSRVFIPRRRHPCRRLLSGYSRPHSLLAASSLCARASPHHNNASPLRSPSTHKHPIILDSSLRALL
jgi:hypothetical protein